MHAITNRETETMTIRFFCPQWGSGHLDPAGFIARVREAGYDGVEVGVDQPGARCEETIRRARGEGLALILQHYDTLDRALDRHLDLFRRRLDYMAAFAPLMINSHTGRDLFGLAENLRVFRVAEEVSRATGVPIVHETHRGRCCHSAWRTVELLRAMPGVRLTLDMSHWCCVSESLLEDQADLLEEIIPRVDHVHARVGWSQGPQVSDPRAPEWAPALQAHLVWWDRVVQRKRLESGRCLGITPEFGPEPYLPVEPRTQRRLADPWDINAHMMNLLRVRYATSGCAG
jgi:hypothetical protein